MLWLRPARFLITADFSYGWHLLSARCSSPLVFYFFKQPIGAGKEEKLLWRIPTVCLVWVGELENQESRVSEIHSLVHRLPEKNRQMLHLLMNHLAKVADNHKQNLMTVANLGVVFGPTLLRPQEETVAAIMDIKFQNIVIEILIENHEKIFNTVPETPPSNSQLLLSRKKSTDSKPPSCSERPLTLFHTAQPNEKQESRNSIINSSLESVISSNANSFLNSNSAPQSNLNSSDLELEVIKPNRPNSLPQNPSPTSPLSPSWPMFSAPSSPMPTSSTSSDSSPISAAICIQQERSFQMSPVPAEPWAPPGHLWSPTCSPGAQAGAFSTCRSHWC